MKSELDKILLSLLHRWLQIDIAYTGDKLSFFQRKNSVTEEIVMDTVYVLNGASVQRQSKLKNFIIAIIALAWEHTKNSEYDLREFIIRILSRIGYPTSAIMVDKGYDMETGEFSGFSSLISEIATSLNQYTNKVMVNNHEFMLTEFQMNIWRSFDENKLLGISAPTSAGKSFAILLKTMEYLYEYYIDIVYIVPTLSLVNQVSVDYKKMIRKLGVLDCDVYNSCIPIGEDENIESEKNRIFILTQEKAMAAFADEDLYFNKHIILIVDEIQNIERIEESQDIRAKILQDTINEFRHEKWVDKIIISGPRIEDIDKLGENLFGEDAIEIQSEVNPVLNLTYSIKQIGNKHFLLQYCSLHRSAIKSEITSNIDFSWYGSNEYNEVYFGFLRDIAGSLGNDSQNIIFAPTAKVARLIANELCVGNQNVEHDKKVAELIEYYKDTVHPEYDLCKTLQSNIVYHHAKLPIHVRRTLELAISMKLVKLISCTTTLIQGVNMPAQNIIIRNPHLYYKQKSQELSSYEMANLRGRAGRLLKDFIGRSFVLDESSFNEIDDYNQLNPFEDINKEIVTGYGDRYNEYRDEIIDALYKNKITDSGMEQYGYLVSYIRQTILRNGKKSIQRLHEVGIDITEADYNVIKDRLRKLKVPLEVCKKNRYWDPFVLDEVYNNFNLELPKSGATKGAQKKLSDILKYFRDNRNTAFMFEKHVPNMYRKGMMRGILCGVCIKWAQEKQLSEILSGSYYTGVDAADHIEDTIELIQKTITYDIPVLLKPLYDMFDEESTFLTAISAGAYHKFTRRMVEMGIPRETALFLYNQMFVDDEYNEEIDIDLTIRNKIKKQIDQLPYWVKVQLDFVY